MKKPAKDNMVPEKASKRSRRDTPNPKSCAKPVIGERDIKWFEFLNRHGDLPSTYLHEYSVVMELGAGYQSTYRRLGKLFHHGYLLRDENQKLFTGSVDRNFCVYRISPKSKAILQKLNLFIVNTPKPSGDNWRHDCLRACYSSSFELECLRRPKEFKYIPHHEIVEDIGKDYLACNGKRTTPDLFQGVYFLKLDNIKVRFINEIDGATVQGKRTDKSIKNKKITMEDRFEFYKQYFLGGQAKEDFSTSGVLLSIVTCSEAHMHYMLHEVVKPVFKKGSNFMLFDWVEGFHPMFKPPKHTFEIIDVPNLRPKREPYIMGWPLQFSDLLKAGDFEKAEEYISICSEYDVGDINPLKTFLREARWAKAGS